MSSRPVARRRAVRVAVLAGCCLWLAGAAVPRPALAVISDASPIDGPSSDIVDIGGVAMAADGTGGLVYRKRVDGRTHIFAARFDGQAWRAPQRVDAGQRFDSSWPAIAAANNGRLVVTWVQEFGAGTDRMFGAVVDEGATRFQAPIPIDFNVGEATATYPSLAMNAGGVAYLTYRVVYSSGEASGLPPDTVDADVRVARTTGSLWTVIGQPMDRNPAIPVRTPDAGNSPHIGVDAGGNAVVAWQEPDDDGFDRIWARRIFGTSPGIPLQVSPSRLGDKRLQAPADQFALDVVGFGAAAVAFRQQPDADAGLPKARIFSNVIPESFSEKANAFAGARIADGLGEGGPEQTPGPATVATTPEGSLLVGYGVDKASLVTPGDDKAPGQVQRLDDGSSSQPGDPVEDVSSSGAAAFGWKLLQDRLGGVALRELRADGVPSVSLLSAPQGGVVQDLRLAGSGLGDAAVEWLQGTGANAQVAAATIDAPPQQFGVATPLGFVRTAKVALDWDPSPNAIGGVTYTITVDDDEVATGLKGLKATLNADELEDGPHTVVVVATDAAGQDTESIPAELKIDRTPPKVRVRTGKRGFLRVSVSDGAKADGSGVSAASTTVRFGDGHRVKGRVRSIVHRYKKSGRYRLVVTTRDKAGNRTRSSGTVRVG